MRRREKKFKHISLRSSTYEGQLYIYIRRVTYLLVDFFDWMERFSFLL